MQLFSSQFVDHQSSSSLIGQIQKLLNYSSELFHVFHHCYCIHQQGETLIASTNEVLSCLRID